MRQFFSVKFCVSYCKGLETLSAVRLCARAGGQLSTSMAMGSPILLIAEGRGSQVPKGVGCGQDRPPADGGQPCSLAGAVGPALAGEVLPCHPWEHPPWVPAS